MFFCFYYKSRACEEKECVTILNSLVKEEKNGVLIFHDWQSKELLIASTETQNSRKSKNLLVSCVPWFRASYISEKFEEV